MLKIIRSKEAKVAKSKSNGDNLNTVRREMSRTFRNKQKEYLNELMA